MKVSYRRLQEYFENTLPSAADLADILTFHAWEIESVENIGDDTVLDVKVLPDRSSWALSHRGIAKEIAINVGYTLKNDPLSSSLLLVPKTDLLRVEILTATCARYTAAVIKGVKIGPSPEWLQNFLVSMGQRSINNVVDITNYVLFDIGQPLHAFDAKKISHEGVYTIHVRNSHKGESITSLTGEGYTLTPDDALIVDGVTDIPLGIAGVKGGKYAEVDSETVDIILESANFNPVAVRKTAQRLKLRTDASVRFENNVSRSQAAYGVSIGASLIVKFCGGEILGYIDTNESLVERTPVPVSIEKINSILGIQFTIEDIVRLFEKRFRYPYQVQGNTIIVTPPHERTDLVIAEDLIEEIGRIHGYDHVVALPIVPIPLREINKRFYYAEKIREILFELGFSEVFTSSFRDSDEVKLANALASDKGYLRSTLTKNIEEAMQKNAGNVELFGTDKVRIFEIGTVFTSGGEKQNLALGVSSKAGVTGKDFKEVQAALASLTEALGVSAVAHSAHEKEGVIEIDLAVLILQLPQPTTYSEYEKSAEVTYKPFSNYPHVVRDIAFWTDGATTQEGAYEVIEKNAGALAVRIDCFDRFEKEGRVSFGFRIVFHSYEKTLTAEEVDAVMQTVSSAIGNLGWVVR